MFNLNKIYLILIAISFGQTFSMQNQDSQNQLEQQLNLKRAVENGNVINAKWAIKRGASVNFVGFDYAPILTYFISYIFSDTGYNSIDKIKDMIDLLVSNGLVIDYDDQPFLVYVLKEYEFERSKNEYVKDSQTINFLIYAIERLVSKGADIDKKHDENEGKTVLEYARSKFDKENLAEARILQILEKRAKFNRLRKMLNITRIVQLKN